MSDQTCNKCRHWDKTDDYGGGDIPNHHLGMRRCLHPKVGGGSYSDEEHKQPDSADSYECIGTGPLFGCVHFDPENATVKGAA